MAEVGLRVNEARCLDLADVRWDLGRFGKLHVRHGKGARGSGPRERMVPLINGAGRTLRWFIEDVRGLFGDDFARHGAPLLPSERHNADGTAARAGAETLRAGLAAAAAAHLPGWEAPLTPHVLRHFCVRVPALPGRDGPAGHPGGTRACLGSDHDGLRARPCHPCRGRMDRWAGTRRDAAGRTGPVSGFLDGALRAHADGDLCAEAAAGLLIAGCWLDRDDFAGFVTVAASPGGGTTVAVIDWPAAVAALGGGKLPCSGERRLLQVTASLAAGIPVSLRDAVTGLDRRNARLVAGAVLHASGHRDVP